MPVLAREIVRPRPYAVLARLAALGVLLTSLMGANGAEATPITFQFNMPAWDSSGGAALWGSNALLDVTVNNGASTDLSQSYALSDIVSLSASAVGGTFSSSWTAADLVLSSNTGAVFISTDGAGVPTLDLLSAPTGAGVDYGNMPQPTVQIGILTPTGGPTPFVLTVGGSGQPLSEASVLGPVTYSSTNGFDYSGIAVTGVALAQTAAVPEPPSLTLFIGGLLGLGFTRWRKRQA
jgi:hypothetical protein